MTKAIVIGSALGALVLFAAWRTAGEPTEPAAPRPAKEMVQAQASDAAQPGQQAHSGETRRIVQDWEVVCGDRGGGRRCSFMQQQANKESGQRVLAIELAPSNDGAAGMLVLPFGLDLQQGVRFQIGDNAPLGAIPFKTCIAAGCLVPVAFDAGTVSTLRSAEMLRLHANIADGAKSAAFQISLRGFGEALDQAAKGQR